MARSRKSRYAGDYRRLLQQLVDARRNADITQIALAERMGTSQSALSKLERGVVRFDVMDVFDYLSGVGVDPVQFLALYWASTSRPPSKKVSAAR